MNESDVLPRRDSPKSRRTRARILGQAMRLFAEIGYPAATNAVIAEASDLTRGAMLYHFPTREALLEAAVAHIQGERLARFEAAAREGPQGADPVTHAVSAYWSLLHSEPFLAFAELERAARTDVEVAQRIAEAQDAFDRLQIGNSNLSLFQSGVGPRFQVAGDLARFALEGLANARLADEASPRTDRLLAVVARAVRMLNRKSVEELWVE